MRRSSRKKNSIKILIAVTIVAATAFGVSQYFVNSSNMGPVVAKVNGEKIYKSQIQQKLLGLLSSPNQGGNLPDVDSLPNEVIEILAKEIYLDDEIAKLAKKENLLKNPEVKGRLHEAKNKILRQAFVDSLIKTEVNDEKISEKYVELTNELQGKKEYLISHIVTKTKDDAEKIAKELSSKKAKFSDAAKKKSLDQESGAKGGELGYILEDNIIKEIASEIVKLKKDEVSAPIQTKFGWHLVKFSETRDAKALPFEQVKDNIKEQLIENKLSEINAEIMKDAKVEVLISKKEAAVSSEEKPAQAAKEEVLSAPASEEKAVENSQEEKATEAKSEEKTEKKDEVKKDEKSHNKKSKNKNHR